MFRKRQQPPPDLGVRPPSAEPTRPADNRTDDPPLPVLTHSEVLATVNLLEDYIRLTPDQQAADLAGTLVVRLLDRLTASTSQPIPD
ncbi:hypothetical protein EV138_1443 [Kribbella voronezhensis]|uniref:Uncharacterized protein n=1 Tax=Kribbella voronezhensis TaxID=2512212 RepID=A0A4R7T9N3_9ACTN|nr:hypothetical protein EV138_1443 [Kribbella voronezhensis]